MFCPCKDCLIVPACRHKHIQMLLMDCKNANTYLFRYIQDTAPKEIGGHNDRLWVIAKTLNMIEFLPVHRNKEAIEIMMEDGNDNPISLQQQIRHTEEVQRLPAKEI